MSMNPAPMNVITEMKRTQGLVAASCWTAAADTVPGPARDGVTWGLADGVE